MVSVSNISYYIGGRALYENASMFIKPKDKIGLIGLNGRGKSTLLRIINGEMKLDAGSISKSGDCTIGFLNQDLLSYQSDDSILTVAMGAFKEVVDIERDIEHIIKKLETEYDDNLVERLSKLQEKYEHLDGYTIQSKAEEVLEGIGFATADLHRPLKQFSGGWRMRVMLSKLLLERPSLLMLDEPTNHLDLPSIEWVENYLRNYEGAVIVVSHDRTFLDNVISKTVDVTNQQLVTYEGNYSFYLDEKELRSQIQQNAYENQQQKIRQTERFIERFRSKATKARQVQSRIKALDRMDMIDEVVDDSAAVNFKFKFNQQPGRFIVTLKDVSKSYGPLELLRKTSISIERGDKIALIGANGKGKSTLLRILSGTESVEGERTMGFNVIQAFYAQHQLESLHVENEILEELKQAGSGKSEQELRNVLGCFLFSEEDVFKKIKVLSGGEKSRVALARTLISEANFLLLDEPTNHLDFISENILIQALDQYLGSFVVVSHNRYFVSQVANKIWYIEDKQIKEYPGTFDEYEYWRKKNEGLIKPEPPKAEKKVDKEKPVQQKSDAPAGNAAALKSLERDLAKAEEAIGVLETQKGKIELELTNPEVFKDQAKLQKVKEQFEKVRKDLEGANKKWEDLAGKIDELSNS
ncbi:ABC-F family ATP-binding cassette domain-containing protein [Chryseolinea sp. T2]|uniref:ABC-F family ATP-binding cassette domain-containing protein n=1 Tax=Chryseolinea sp. T2 TaxID=3129255 RepID=UPI003076D800